MIECRSPKSSEEFKRYFELRWAVLRSPWGQPKGSEQDAMEQQSIHRHIVDDRGNVLAVGRLHFNSQYSAQIRYMAVDENEQGHGYGKMVLNALEQEASVRGADKITLHAREVALKFYQRMEYMVVGKSHLLYDNIQHYEMTKELAPQVAHLQKVCDILQKTWHSTIPLSKAMNIGISYFDREILVTHCDSEFNKNLHNTMFAGSIYALATLTGWGWVYLQLIENDGQGDIVLADANIKYFAPIEGVVSAKTSVEAVKGDTKMLQKNKKSRFTIEVRV